MSEINGAAWFLALRELTGMSRQYVADQLNITEEAVKLWESGARPLTPEAIEWMKGELARFDALVDKAISELESFVVVQNEKMGLPPDELPGATISYYQTQDQYDRYGRGPGEYKMANAAARAIGEKLRTLGYDVVYQYPQED